MTSTSRLEGFSWKREGSVFPLSPPSTTTTVGWKLYGRSWKKDDFSDIIFHQVSQTGLQRIVRYLTQAVHSQFSIDISPVCVHRVEAEILFNGNLLGRLSQCDLTQNIFLGGSERIGDSFRRNAFWKQAPGWRNNTKLALTQTKNRSQDQKALAKPSPSTS